MRATVCDDPQATCCTRLAPPCSRSISLRTQTHVSKRPNECRAEAGALGGHDGGGGVLVHVGQRHQHARAQRI
jgi:hypothetical protein